MKIVFLFLFIVVNLYAHKLNLFLDVEEKKLYVYSYFASGSPCKDCKLEFYDLKNKLLKQVKTNSEGEYYLKDYENVVVVKVEALGGHAIERKFNLKQKDNVKEVKPKTSQESYISSFIAIVVLVLIFLLLRRIKK